MPVWVYKYVLSLFSVTVHVKIQEENVVLWLQAKNFPQEMIFFNNNENNGNNNNNGSNNNYKKNISTSVHLLIHRLYENWSL